MISCPFYKADDGARTRDLRLGNATLTLAAVHSLGLRGYAQPGHCDRRPALPRFVA